MIEEKAPQYFKDFEKTINTRLDAIENKIESEVESLAISTANEFRQMNERFNKLDKKVEQLDFGQDEITNQLYVLNEKIGKIEGHIGRYEIRNQNIEEIVIKEHKPSIIALEKVVFGV